MSFLGANYLVWLVVYTWYSSHSGPVLSLVFAPLLTMFFVTLTAGPLVAVVSAIDCLILSRRPGWVADVVLIVLTALPAAIALRDPANFEGPSDFCVELTALTLTGGLIVLHSRRARRRAQAGSDGAVAGAG